MACIDVYTLRDRAAGNAASNEAQDSLHNIETAVSALVKALRENGIDDDLSRDLIMDAIDGMDGYADIYQMAQEAA
jgi:hypothetical protein